MQAQTLDDKLGKLGGKHDDSDDDQNLRNKAGTSLN